MITNHFLVAALTWEFWKFPRAMCHWGWPNRTSKKYRTKHRKSPLFQQRQHFDDVNLMARCLILYGLIKQHVIHSVIPSYPYRFDHSKIYIYIYIISFQYICVVNFKGQPTLPPPLVSWPHPRPWRRMALPRKKELDLNGFLALRANSGFMEGAAQVAGLWGGDDDSEKSRWGCHNGCIYSLRLETFFFFFNYLLWREQVRK